MFGVMAAPVLSLLAQKGGGIGAPGPVWCQVIIVRVGGWVLGLAWWWWGCEVVWGDEVVCGGWWVMVKVGCGCVCVCVCDTGYWQDGVRGGQTGKGWSLIALSG